MPHLQSSQWGRCWNTHEGRLKIFWLGISFNCTVVLQRFQFALQTLVQQMDIGVVLLQNIKKAVKQLQRLFFTWLVGWTALTKVSNRLVGSLAWMYQRSFSMCLVTFSRAMPAKKNSSKITVQ